MLTERRDYILRLIQQAGAALRRLRERLLGEADAGADVAAETAVEIGALLGGGTTAALIERVDAATAVMLVADRERIGVWVELLRLRADALASSGAGDEAAVVRERADALAAAATRLP